MSTNKHTSTDEIAHSVNFVAEKLVELDEKGEVLKKDIAKLATRLGEPFSTDPKKTNEPNEITSARNEIYRLEHKIRIGEFKGGASEAQASHLKLGKLRKVVNQYDLEQSEFEVDGKKYRFVCPVIILEGHRLTLQEMLADDRILRYLVEMNAGSITQID